MKRKIDTVNLCRDTITELKKFGYHLCNDFEKSEQLHYKLNLDFNNLLKIPESTSAFELYQQEIKNGCILSYNKQLDNLLLNVIVPKSITELTGSPGTGKTQICFQLAASAQLPEWCGGLHGEVIFLSTNRNFAPNRLRELAHNFVTHYESVTSNVNREDKSFDEESIMRKIYYKKIRDASELMSAVNQLETFLMNKNVKLLIIDSVSYPLRLLEIKKRITFISELFQTLRLCANKFNFAVLITNDLTTRTDENKSFTTPSFGDSFYHFVNSRILLSKQGSMFNGKLVKNIEHTQKEVNFYL